MVGNDLFMSGDIGPVPIVVNAPCDPQAMVALAARSCLPAQMA
jgi:hypothetical protein